MLGIFAAVVIVVTGIVLAALDRVGAYANHLDEERSREVVRGAIHTYIGQLRNVLNDSATRDDTVAYLHRQLDLEWLRRNLGELTGTAELFDVAVVIDQDGRSMIGYADGVLLGEQQLANYLTPDVRDVFRATKAIRGDATPQLSGFVKTAKGLAAFSIALVRDRSESSVVDTTGRRYLLFMRHLTSSTVDQLARTYALPGLHLADADAKASHRVNILSPLAKPVGALAWESRAPGDISLEQVRPLVWCAVAMVAIYFLLLFVSGWQALARFRADEAAAVRLSLTDRLSGLSNRAGLFGELEKLIDQAREDGTDVALLYLDLDGFKEVNDAYGHNTGDRLIKGVSAGLKVLVGEGAVLARLGGDEFAVALSGRDAERRVIDISDRVLDFLGEPFTIGERVAVIGCSIGVAISARGMISGEEIVRRADMAMYCAKEEGRGRWTRYDPAMDEEREERNNMELDLREAIERQEISVAFQPVVDARSLDMVGVEALARWTRKGHGNVPPDVFIPIAESTGLIDQLGLCVLRNACLALRQWPDLSLAVNVSPGQFRDPAFATYVEDVLHDTGTDASRITLEMTETYFIQNPARARGALERLKQTGVKIALDDFGSGFSSVGYLRQFHFDRMKIDRSLVESLGQNDRALDVLKATVSLARALDIPVTAEGVETDVQVSALKLAGCDLLQGYFFGRPMSEREIAARRGVQPVSLSKRA
ncbi:bifunctional diguanylate cyclase/phosphodiesterase [Rhizobium oryzicola]|uniref:Bifunctional diguanylate cyclase/phosphodiesterase n=2 Tax=Rhizobium oryzicola TaxID=1232668 RepID=A0ABT8T127_9HYPH|nr:bifunctional diguanylate cyclase/phosphodiesterase [Rhizobium oryzicola]MDO1584337.1 bifunctional diguanylate cyclase/phosphodiesterase [Rhizobium oryzicola]